VEPLWTTQETAEFLSLSEQTLCNWRWRGGSSPPFVKLNGAIRYDPEAVREWVAEHLRHSTSDPGRSE
jgi:predicted DNA-binding transcriptional regulator AlpA